MGRSGLSTGQGPALAQTDQIQIQIDDWPGNGQGWQSLPQSKGSVPTSMKAQNQYRMTLETLSNIKTRLSFMPSKPTSPMARNRSTMETCLHARTRKKTKIRQANFWSKAMNNGWTPKRKTKQAAAIQRWKPWQQATVPKSPEGKARVSRNAFRAEKDHC